MSPSHRKPLWSGSARAMGVQGWLIAALATAVCAFATACRQPAPGALSQPRYEVITEKDVKIPLRDGGYLVADVFRPRSSEKFPVIMSMSLYLKDIDVYQYNEETKGFNPSFGNREVPHYQWWVPRGYVIIRVDARGTGKSLGNLDHWSVQEGRDYYDAIEWAGVQSWSSGKVGLSGVSNFAINQWIVAGLQPPHLTTIVPWEGFSDLYREAAFPGGIWGSFYTNWQNSIKAQHLLFFDRVDQPNAFSENIPWTLMVHRMDGPWWDEVKGRGQFDKIEVPLYSSGNWNGWNLHLRGNTEGYMRSASKNKKLEMHIKGHTTEFFGDRGLTEQLRWYDYWLKGNDTGIMNEPPVKLCVRTSLTECTWRYENEFPIARAQYTRFYLTAQKANAVKDSLNDGMLTRTAPGKEEVTTYNGLEAGNVRGGAGRPAITFASEPMTADTEVTGHVNLVVWVSSTTDDMDIFTYLRQIKPDGKTWVLGRGMLKVSHRKLDSKLSTPYRPFHTHDQEQKLRPGEVVEAQVEIWPTTMVFQKGDRIRLDIYSMGFNPDGGGRTHYDGIYNIGDYSIYSGGKRASYLLLPVIPPGGQPVTTSTTTAP